MNIFKPIVASFNPVFVALIMIHLDPHFLEVFFIFQPFKKHVAFPLALGGLEIFGSAWAIQLLVCQGMCWWENVWETDFFYPLNIRVSRYKQVIFEYKFVKKCGITATIVIQWWSLQYWCLFLCICNFFGLVFHFSAFLSTNAFIYLYL